MERRAAYRTSPSKYHNRRVVVDDIAFDSQAEAARWRELKLLEAAGAIVKLCHHPRFELIPALTVDGKRERAIVYEADFAYRATTVPYRLVVEEVKGHETETWRLKRRLFMRDYPEHELRVIKR